MLEIFDGDGNDPADAAGGNYPGTAGCDANLDNQIDAGDLSCTVLIIFSDGGACGAQNRGAPAPAVADTEPKEATSTIRQYLPLIIQE